MTRQHIHQMIDNERDRQMAKWGRHHSWGRGDCSSVDVAADAACGDTADLLRLAVLHEEVGEVARAVLDRDHTNLRSELVQVAAVCVAWLEGMR